MLHRPRFKANYRVEIVEGDGVFLFSEDNSVALNGRLHQLIGPLIDGRRAVNEIVEAATEASPAEVYYTLQQLEARGYIAESDDALPASEQALWASHHLDPSAAAAQLEQSWISLSVLGDLAVEPLRAALETARVRVAPQAALSVVVTDDYLASELEHINRAALEAGRSLMLIRPCGCEIWIGPLIVPGATGCWECLAHRLRGNRIGEWYVRSRRGFPASFPVAKSHTPTTLALAYQLAATEIAACIVRGTSTALEGKVLSLDVRTWQTHFHPVIRRPQCPACGDPSMTAAKPIELQSARYARAHDGGCRSVAPEATLERYAQHVSRVTGALPGLERAAGAKNGVMHVYYAGPNNARASKSSFSHLQHHLRNLNSGKGTSDLNARVSALCEGLERYSGTFQSDEPRRRARGRELGSAGIFPNQVMLFSERQYCNRQTLNARPERVECVPLLFDPDDEIEWTPLWSLTREEFRFLPTSHCYYSYPNANDREYCSACSTGNAAGNTIEEAILQGFFELAERDAVAIWWYNRLRRPALDLDAFDDAYLERIRALYAARRRELWALDLTNDFGIPVVAAISRRTDDPAETILFGFGAHFDPKIALLRAVTELNQMLALFLRGEGGENAPETCAAPTMHWLRTATVAAEPYVLPDPKLAPRRLAKPQTTGDVRDDVILARTLVERAGMEMLVLDQTRPDIGLPVVKVVVPGMRHFWERFAPGRLYDVPVKLGWLARARSEEELNPNPMFL